MAKGRIGKYERLILRPLSIILSLAAVAYFLLQSWGIGIFLVVMWFLVGACGQALNPKKTFSELTQGYTEEEREVPLSAQPTTTETIMIGRLSLAVFWIVGITVSILGHHHGLRWLLAVPLGISTAFIAILLGGWISMRDD